MTRLVTFAVAFGVTYGLVQSCGGTTPPASAPVSACDGGACPMPDGGDKTAGSVPAEPDDAMPPPPPDPPGYGSVVVTLRTAEGLVHAILCGGEVSSDLGSASCPYDHNPDSGRTLLKLQRPEGLTR